MKLGVKITVGLVGTGSVIVLLWLGGFFKLTNYLFAAECLAAEDRLDACFHQNKDLFYSLVELTEKHSAIYMESWEPDFVELWVSDTSHHGLSDSTFVLRSETDNSLRPTSDGFLDIDTGTLKTTYEGNWTVQFYGNYRDSRIDPLLNHIGWSREDFESLFAKTKVLNCFRLTSTKDSLELMAPIVFYHPPLRWMSPSPPIHRNGFFGYLFVRHSENQLTQSNLEHYEGSTYAFKKWCFNR